jgi:glutaredoxin
MTRWALVLIPLLLACSPPSDSDPTSAPAAPGARGARPTEPLNPKPTRQPSAPRKGKRTLEAAAPGAGYYQYVDESGHVRFAASLDAVPERQRSTAGPVASAKPPGARSPAQQQVGFAQGQTSRAAVILYTTETCPLCRRARAYLDQIGQDYVNKDVESDEDARDEYMKLTSGRTGVPVIVVGEKWMQGWNQTKLEALLADSR